MYLKIKLTVGEGFFSVTRHVFNALHYYHRYVGDRQDSILDAFFALNTFCLIVFVFSVLLAIFNI